MPGTSEASVHIQSEEHRRALRAGHGRTLVRGFSLIYTPFPSTKDDKTTVLLINVVSCCNGAGLRAWPAVIGPCWKVA